jgi:hypothetical protein
MLRIGFAIAAIFGVAGLALMAMGYSAAPTAANAMLFTAGAVLLGAAGISLSIAGAVYQPAATAAPAARAERSTPPMPDPFATQAKAPSLDPVMPAAAAAGAVIGSVTIPTVAAPDVPSLDPEPVDLPPMTAERFDPPVSEPVPVPAPSFEEAMTPQRTMPSFELPPLRPRQTMDTALELPELPGMAARKEPVMETLESVIIAEAVAAPEPVAESTGAAEQVAAEPSPAEINDEVSEVIQDVEDIEITTAEVSEVAPAAVEEAPDTFDPFDLEAAIAAELGVAPRMADEEAVLAGEPAEIEEADMEPMAEEETFAIQPDADVAPVEEPAAETASEEATSASSADVVVGSYESGGVLYTLYEDGSVTAEAGGVKERYESLEALRTAFDAA